MPDPARPRRSRKSIATMPTAGAAAAVGKENAPSSSTSSFSAPEPASNASHKSRSKSLGPGGLAALRAAGEREKEKARGAPLRAGTGNGRRASVAPVVKSILKPTLPLSPLQPIPAHHPRSQQTQYNDASGQARKPVTARLNFDSSLPQPPTTVPVRTEEEQQRRAEILAARAARRLSLGNRRVSFAPEATLHTWDVVEYYRDDGSSTPGSSTSSGSRTSTPASNRRSSSGSLPTATPTPATPTPSAIDRPSTPPEQVEAELPETPPSVRDAHQKKNRHVSTMKTPPMNFNNPDDEEFSSPFTSSPEQNRNAFPAQDAASSDSSDSSDSLDDDSAGEDRTFISAAGDITLGEEDMDVDITGGFKPIFKKPAAWRFDGETEGIPSSPPAPTPGDGEDGGEMTMEVTRAVGGLVSSSSAPEPAGRTGPSSPDTEDSDGEMTMHMTRPLGGILANAANALEKAKRQSLGFQSPADATMDMDMTRAVGGILDTHKANDIQYPVLKPSADEEMDVDMEMETDMDMTRPIGGILANANRTTHPGMASPAPSISTETDGNEEMTMEFTSVLGGIVGGAQQGQKARRVSSSGAQRGGLMKANEWEQNQAEKQKVLEQVEGGANMDETVAVGGIFAPQPARPVQDGDGDDTEEEDVGMGDDNMDITTDVGAILLENFPKPSPGSAEAAIKQQKTAAERTKISEELEAQQPSSNGPSPDLPLSVPSADSTIPAVPSPTPVPRRRSSSRRSSAGVTTDTTEKRVTRRTSAARKSLESAPAQDTKTPSPAKCSTPAKREEENSAPASILKALTSNVPSTPKPATPLKQQKPEQLASIPGLSNSVKFSASKLGSPTKGMGIDRPGLGSPAVAAKLSRRKSLGEEAVSFSPVSIASTLIQASREDKERERAENLAEKLQKQEEERKLDLRSRINLLTPKKAGRKSIAFGALMGEKRPLANDAVQSATKRRRSLDSMPIMSEEDDDDVLLTRSGRKLAKRAVLPTPGNGRKKAPRKNELVVGTPNRQTSQAVKFQEPKEQEGKPDVEAAESTADGQDNHDEEDAAEGNYSLKEFLEMIDISFLDDLTTTKRRHTGFIGKKSGLSTADGDDEDEGAGFADCVAAGACTVPMLELFQHSCRELRKYIKEGRAVVKEIEQDTLADNPPLFREYDYAPADVKAVMDTQFREIKTHARLLAKGIWYDWRMKLLDGVKEGLEANLAGLKRDEQLLSARQQVIEPLLPTLRQRCQELKATLDQMLEMKRRIEADDQDELRAARAHLREITDRIDVVREEVVRKRRTADELGAEIEAREQVKKQLQAAINEAERIKELNRGWSIDEVRAWKAKVHSLELSSGWTILRALPSGALELSFCREIKLVVGGGVVPTVEHLTDPTHRLNNTRRPMPPLERDFFLATLNARIASEPNAKKVLKLVSAGWTNAQTCADNVRRLRAHHPTAVTTAGEQLEVRTTVLVPELRSKMELRFVVGTELVMRAAGARVIYGGISEDAVAGLLSEWRGGWREGVGEVVERCLESRRRGGTVVAVKSG